MYIIWGKYDGETEEIDSAETKDEALRLLAEYRMAFGFEWSLWIRRVEE